MNNWERFALYWEHKKFNEAKNDAAKFTVEAKRVSQQKGYIMSEVEYANIETILLAALVVERRINTKLLREHKYV